MLVFTGLRLGSPKEVAHAKAIGIDQLAYFLVTLIVTLAEDLLVGVAAGIVLKIVVHTVRVGSLGALFRTKFHTAREGSILRVRVEGPATFLALLKAQSALAAARDAGVTEVVLDLSDAPLVDHTFLERVHGWSLEWPTAKLELSRQEHLVRRSEHPHAARHASRAQVSNAQ